MLFNEKVIIYSEKNHFSIDEMKECFHEMPENIPSYFKNIPRKIFSQEMQTDDMSRNTLKTCSGFINLFKRSILFCSPFDMQFVFKDEKIHFRLGTFPVDIQQFIDLHPEEQFLKYAPEAMKNNIKCVLRFKSNMYIKSTCNILQHHPSWHDTKFTAASGILTKNCEINMNVFFFVNKNQEEVIVKKGDPLAYMTFLTDKKVKFKYKSIEKKEHPLIKTFSRLKKFTIDKI